MIFKKRTDGNIDKWDEKYCGNFQYPDSSNPWCLQLDEWLAGGNVLVYSELETLAVKKENLSKIRKNYLVSTDWFIQREFDKPNTYPQEVKEKRMLARTQINGIEFATKTTINNYSMEF